MPGNKDLLLIKTQYVRIKYAPLGLMYVAAAAERKGAKVVILDLSLEDNYKRVLKASLLESHPRLVGIGGMYEEFDEIKRVAAFVKEILPDALVVVGGPIGPSLTSGCLKDKNIDIVALGEGESLVQDLLCYLQGKIALSEIKGIAFRDNAEVSFTAKRPIEDINAMPIPAWHLIDPSRYFQPHDNWFGIDNLKALNIAPSRGCPYSCVFCDKGTFGHKWRGRDPKNIIDEMVLLRDNYGAQAILFADDIFDVNKEWAISFIEEIKLRGVNMYWGCASRVNLADYELYKKMYDAGCRYLFFGIEFGSEEMLKVSNKRTTIGQVYQAIDAARKAGLRTIGAYILGMLDETEEQINQTVEMALRSRLDVSSASIVTPIAGTPLFDMALRAGKISKDQPWWRAGRLDAYINLTKDVSSRRLTYLASKMYWVLFWSRPSRKIPGFMCKIMKMSFFIFSPLSGQRFINLITWFTRLRQKLRLGLP
ncbi:MAG: radical SAM protein [Candidatus Omnitrophica bacterium]|nr:radical SAM protein [Candidatus Omnitrophota bacterium]